MPALFKRKPAEATDAEADDTEVTSQSAESEAARTRDKETPTPKRPKTVKKRPPKNPPRTYKEAREQAKAQRGPKPDKEARRTQAAERRAERERIAAAHDRGDPNYDQYHMPRDKGPERLLVRDIVDARRGVGQYFFIVALIVMLLSSNPQNAILYQIGVLAWIGLLLAFIVDSFILVRKVNRLVAKRFPKTKQGKFGLGWYAVSRSIMFKRLRMPRPRPGISPRSSESELGKHFR